MVEPTQLPPGTFGFALFHAIAPTCSETRSISSPMDATDGYSMA